MREEVILRKDKDTGELYLVFPNRGSNNKLECFSSVDGTVVMDVGYFFKHTFPYTGKDIMDLLVFYAGESYNKFYNIKKKLKI